MGPIGHGWERSRENRSSSHHTFQTIQVRSNVDTRHVTQDVLLSPQHLEYHPYTPHNSSPTANVTAADNNAMLPHTVAASAVTDGAAVCLTAAAAAVSW